MPVTAELSRLHVTVSRRFLGKLEAVRAALSYACPGATAEEILEALDLVLAQHAKRKGLVAKDLPPAKPDHVPDHVQRAVWVGDGGPRRVGETAIPRVMLHARRLELDHPHRRAALLRGTAPGGLHCRGASAGPVARPVILSRRTTGHGHGHVYGHVHGRRRGRKRETASVPSP